MGQLMFYAWENKDIFHEILRLQYFFSIENFVFVDRYWILCNENIL